MRWIMVAAVGSLLTASVSSAVAAFETPEAAVREYLEGVAEASIERVVDATAVEEMSENYGFDRMVERVGSYQPLLPGPVHSPFFAGVEQAMWTSDILRQARTLAYSLLAADTLGEAIEQTPLFDVDSAWVEGFTADLDESRLASLVVVDVRLPVPVLSNSDINLETLARGAWVYGADEMTDRVALVLFEDETYAVGFQLLRYGDDWKVRVQNSPIASLPPTGAATPMSPAEFTELTSE